MNSIRNPIWKQIRRSGHPRKGSWRRKQKPA